MPRPIAAFLMLLALPAGAQELAPGADLYFARCATCHGAGGRGDGPMAALLSKPVPDLTGLSARNGGEFPRIYAVQTIDGGYRGHGGPMPVFGPLMGGGSAVIDGPDGSVVETSLEILRIVDHLERIQTE